MSETEQTIPIVVIGASAGGLRALQMFFTQMPVHTGAAFVIAMHLDPRQPSHLADILATHTHMPVTTVVDSILIEANHLYVIPPDRHLAMVDHDISAIPLPHASGQRTAIDALFRSMSERLHDGFAVVLSGAGSDGAIGVKDVKGAGGIILVQDPRESEYGSMPRAAIETGVADFVLPIEQMVERLVDLFALRREGIVPDVTDEEWLGRTLIHLRIQTGHDFSNYKQTTIIRRVMRRMQILRIETLQSYYQWMCETAGEAQALFSELLVSVTSFFRDREVFDLIATTIVPKMFENKSQHDTIRVWVAASATGEEAYTFAILLLEEADRRPSSPRLQVFASDIDSPALANAREGWYSTGIEADVSPERLSRFFVRDGNGYRVSQSLRDMVLFATHDLLKDPPFSRLDFVSCRNFLIYIDRILHDQILRTIHYALNIDGYLLLGSAETADSDLFSPVNRPARIYQPIAALAHRIQLPQFTIPPAIQYSQPITIPAVITPSEVIRHREALEKVAPPSVLVDQKFRLEHLSENAGRYMMPSGGTASLDVTDIVRPELRLELRTALHRVFEQNEAVLSPGITVSFNGRHHSVHLLVKPNQAETLQAIVMFIESNAIESAPETKSDDMIRRLSEELRLAEARLRKMREESDNANEDLRATNEELQSMNEEYRSTSEELETSREELQSINEELQSVNAELKISYDTLVRAHSDLQNLMTVTNIATLFLDGSLKVRRFTDRISDLFGLAPGDEGRSIRDFASHFRLDFIITAAETVLTTMAPSQQEMATRDGQWYEVQMRPYRTIEGKIDGVVISFIDVTKRRQAEDILRASESKHRLQYNWFMMSRAPIIVWDFKNGVVVEWNQGCERLYGYTSEEAIGRTISELFEANAQMEDELRAKGNWSGKRYAKVKGQILEIEGHLQLETMTDGQYVIEIGYSSALVSK